MSSASIIDPRRKLDWANRHLEAVRSQSASFFDTYPDPFEVHFDSAESCYVFVFKEQKRLPSHWGLIVGDVVSNARSALDHLIWQLVLANDTKPGTHNSFPVCYTERAWIRSVERRSEGRGPGPLDGVTEAVRTIVKGLQPYHVGDRNAAETKHWLGGLHRLWNIDKHQIIHQTHALLPGIEPKITMNPEGVTRLAEWGFVSTATVLQDGGEVVKARVMVDTRVPDPQVGVHLDCPISIAFGDDSFMAPIAAIINSVKGVGLTLNAFENEFPF
jgi:hypothetical protein